MAIASALLSGCVPKATVSELEGVPGRLSGTIGRPGVVLAAPHGISDARTAVVRSVVALRFWPTFLRNNLSRPPSKMGV